MNFFFDTSVLVAASAADHPHHARAFSAIQQAGRKPNKGWMSQHSIAEVYSVLTKAPLVPRVHPTEALRIIEDNLLPLIGVVGLGPKDYREVVREVAAGGWRSGKVYDALHIRCASKQPIDRLLTFNVRDFLALAPPSLQKKICAP